MLKKITLVCMAILLMMNVYIGVTYADDKKVNEVSVKNTVTNENVANQTVSNTLASNETKSQNAVSNENMVSNEENNLEEKSSEKNISNFTKARAKVIETGEVRKVKNGSVEDTIQTIKIEVLEGKYETKEYSIDYVLSYDVEGKILAYKLNQGNKVIVQILEEQDGNVTVTIDEVERVNYVCIMAIILFAIIIIVGGKQGVKAVVSLMITLLAMYFILIKSIFAGINAILASIITSFIVIAVTFIITLGINKKSLTVILGSFIGTLVAGILAIIFGNLAKLSGATEEAIQLSLNLKTIEFNFRELIFTAIVVSSIGICMDIGINIVNKLEEYRSKTQDFTRAELFKKGMIAGREAIGTMSNTLILVYIGGIIKLLLLYLACNMEITYIVSKEAFSEQLISAMAGTIGVILTVPITSIIYACINRNKTIYKTVSENKIEGKRSLKI